MTMKLFSIDLIFSKLKILREIVLLSIHIYISFVCVCTDICLLSNIILEAWEVFFFCKQYMPVYKLAPCLSPQTSNWISSQNAFLLHPNNLLSSVRDENVRGSCINKHLKAGASSSVVAFRISSPIFVCTHDLLLLTWDGERKREGRGNQHLS